MELQKRILRTVVNEIIVAVDPASEPLELRLHWSGGVHTLLPMHKHKSGRNGHATDKDVLGLVRELAKAWPDANIAGLLNRPGCHPGPGHRWNETRVKNPRRYHEIPGFTKGCERLWLTMAEAAGELKAGAGVIRTMIEHRILPARQAAQGAPWMIEREDLKNADAPSYAKQAHTGKPVPRGPDNQTLMLYR